MATLFRWLGVALWLHLLADTPGIQGEVAVQTQPRLQSPDAQVCWVFHHMVKSGGTTVKHYLHLFGRRERMLREEYANRQWLEGRNGYRRVRNILQGQRGVIYGGYAEGLRMLDGYGRCRWFTIFREPMSRLVSAFFYCKYLNRKDPLCAQDEIDLGSADLESFAQHWGNYGLRQYVLGFLDVEDLLASSIAKECPTCPGWYIVKNYLEQRPLNASLDVVPGGTDEADVLSTYLEPVFDAINSTYAAVGILEEMDTTLKLFDCALGMPHFSWTKAFLSQGSANVDKQRKDEEEKSLLEATGNPRIEKYIQLDRMLYELALRVNARQVERFGLGSSSAPEP